MKTFLMCVGAQKAGTTWMWHYLRRNPKVDLGFKKEYHVWDVLTIPEYQFFKSDLESKINTGRDNLYNFTQLSFMNDPAKYYDYFISKLNSCDITGDFTPQSSSLSEDTFHSIIAKFDSHDIQTKCIFIMRDPVDRLQSMIRMKLALSGNMTPSYELETLMMLEHCSSKNYYYTGDYSTIVPKLDKIFQSKVCYKFFDTLFTDQSQQSVCDFMNISFHQPDYNFNPKPSKTPNMLTVEDRLHFEQMYKPIYDYTADRFPEVTKLWTYYQK
jgi:hypothetical protein